MSDQIITSIPLIKRYSRHNEDQDWRFRSFLKGSSMPSEQLDSTVQAITDEVWKQIDCTTCANCCKTMAVAVDREDIARLSKLLALSPAQFSAQYVELVEGGTYFKSQPCAFLGADNKCSVYEDRPKACRDFPYLHRKNFTSRSIMMVSNLEVCPIVFNVWQRLRDTLWGQRNSGGRRRRRR